MSARTPGEWRYVAPEVLEDGSVYPAHIVGGANELQVCLLESLQDAAERCAAGRDVAPRRAADGRLIAAAPELLEALIDCRRALEIANFTQELAVVDAAIAKAAGAAA